MKRSEQINELAQALAKAQGTMKGAEKDSRNPHLSNKYASLSAIIEAARKPLSDNGLAFSQLIGETEGGVVLETLLMHSSGQWLMADPVTITTLGNKGINEAQALGSGLTYFKRYTLAAMLGISVADEDDDGNAAQVQVGRQQGRRADTPNGARPQAPEQPTQPRQERPSPPQTEQPRPFSPAELKGFLARKVGEIEAKHNGNSKAPATEKQLGLLCRKLEECFAPDEDADNKRLFVLEYLWGVEESAKELTFAQASASLAWLLDGQDDGGDYKLHAKASLEAKTVLEVWLEKDQIPF